MDDLIEQNETRDLLPIERCRQLLADEATGLTDDDVDVIRRHAHALAHTLLDVFIRQPATDRE